MTFHFRRALGLRRIVINNRRCFHALPRYLYYLERPSIVRDEGAFCSPFNSAPQGRRLKSTTHVKVEDLPQGILDIGPVEQDVQQKAYPTVVRQAKENMENNPGCVLLTRVGGFYELYLDQAEKYGPLLGLKVARKKTNPLPVAMAGFPFFQLDRYLKTLVQDFNVSVALSEEFANNAADKVKSGGLMFDRRVTRIVSAGTLIDESFMDPYENNYLLSIHVPDEAQASSETLGAEQSTQSERIGLAWMDLSTGGFFTQTCEQFSVSSVVTSISPREVIINVKRDDEAPRTIKAFLDSRQHPVVRFQSTNKYAQLDSWSDVLESAISEEAVGQFSPIEAAAGASLLEYGASHLQGLHLKLQTPVRRQITDNMEIDRSTMRALEIKETISDRTMKGSLLHAIRRTVTKSGARLLSNWLVSPSTSLFVIKERLNLVTLFHENETLREDITISLSALSDTQRLVQKFSLGRGDSDDLISLSKSIKAIAQVASILSDFIETAESSVERGNDSTDVESFTQYGRSIVSRMSLDKPMSLAQRIDDAIDEEGLLKSHELEDSEAAQLNSLAQQVSAADDELKQAPTTSTQQKTNGTGKRAVRNTISPVRSIDHEVWIMKKDASTNLAKLHKSLNSLIAQRDDLAESLRTKLDALSLTLRWTPGLGHICHVKGKDAKISLSTAIPDAKNVSSSKTTRSFYLPEWTSLGGKLDQAKLRIRAEEQNIFRRLEKEVILNLVSLRRNAAVMDELDVACSSALLAKEQGLVRPTLNPSIDQSVIGGRHPTVDVGLQGQGRSFTPNDCMLSKEKNIWLITGPNMGGKSTFLRQNALLYILAQSGQYVPAKFAEIGIVDKMFSRVGSADNLSNNQSTFMLEMLETAAILNRATRRSFVIMDEVGRGTTPEDGVAIGFASLHHLYHRIKCRTLFATHYYRLADMLGGLDGVGCYCTRLREDRGGNGGGRGGFVYDYRIQEGVNRDSHALKTARLAGLPDSVIELARKTLEQQRSGGGEG